MDRGHRVRWCNFSVSATGWCQSQLSEYSDGWSQLSVLGDPPCSPYTRANQPLAFRFPLGFTSEIFDVSGTELKSESAVRLVSWLESVVRLVSWPESAVGPVSWPESAVGPVSWPESAVGPVSWPESAVGPVSWPESAVRPVSWPESAGRSQLSDQSAGWSQLFHKVSSSARAH